MHSTILLSFDHIAYVYVVKGVVVKQKWQINRVKAGKREDGVYFCSYAKKKRKRRIGVDICS